MKIDKLFIGDIYTLKKENFKYGPWPLPLSLASTTYDINFKKRTLLYMITDGSFIDLCAYDKNKIKSSNNIINVGINEDFVMIDKNLLSLKKELIENNIKKKYISNKLVKELAKKFK